MELRPEDLRIQIAKIEKLPEGVDLRQHETLVAVGRGIGENPTQGIKLGLELAKVLGTDLGISRGVVTASYPIDPSVEQYVEEERQIGETGQTVEPKVYVALGISGAIQHKKGMDKSKFIVSINTAEETPIREFSDVYVVGDLFEITPKLAKALAKRLAKRNVKAPLKEVAA